MIGNFKRLCQMNVTFRLMEIKKGVEINAVIKW